MFDYFNSTRKANQILARIAKIAFNSEETKPIVACHENSSSLDSGKIVLKLSKLNRTMWKVSTPLAKKTESSGEKVVTSDDIFNPSAQKSKKKLAKKRKLGGKNLQVEEGRVEIPRKKRRVLVKKIMKRDDSIICISNSSIRRSKRLATKAEEIQNIKDKAVADLYCSAIVSQPSKRKKSTEDQSCLKAEGHKLRRIQNSSSNFPS